MARNDSVLNTGLSSALDHKLAERRKDAKKEQAHIRAKLKPEAEAILAVITSERDWVRNEIANLPFNLSVHKDDLSIYLQACQMHLDWTIRATNKLKAILKVEEDKPDGRA
jgi:phosphoribosyl-ATP pyrophosphohydrolase